MSSVIIAGDTSGSVTLQAPATAGSTVVNLPSTLGNTGTSAFATTDASGNLGLGVTPSAWNTLKGIEQQNGTFWASYSGDADSYFGANAYYNSGWVRKIAGYATYYRQTTGQHQWAVAASSTAGSAISFTQAMTLDASGNLGVGTTSSYGGRLTLIPAANPTTASASTNQLAIGESSVNSAYKMLVGYINIGGGYAGSVQALAGGVGTNLLLNADGGNVLVGKTASGDTTAGFQITTSGTRVSTTSATSTNVGGDNYHMYSTGASAYRFYVGWGGTVYATSTTISAISDIRFKENVRDLDTGLAEVMALKPRMYDWKEGKGADIKNARGFIAQEFEQVFPDLIDEWKDPAPEGEEPYKSVRQDLIPVLVKAIQEQQALINAQQTVLNQLQADVAALKGQ